MDRTVLKRPQPLFAIGSSAYARASASRGFLESLKIATVDFDPARRTYVYRWEINKGPAAQHALSPIRLYESELINQCQAVTIQLSVLQRQLAELQAQQKRICPGPPVVTSQRITIEINGTTQAPAPLFGDNEVVYLREMAETVGRLESYRITSLKWRNDLKQWLYGMFIHRRPGRNMTIGDRGDLTKEFALFYPESELCTICEALPLAVSYMTQAVAQAQLRVDGCK